MTARGNPLFAVISSGFAYVIFAYYIKFAKFVGPNATLSIIYFDP